MPPTPREIKRTASFDKDLARLERKHRGAASSVEKYLEQCTVRQPGRHLQQQGLGGKPVFKERLALPGIGKRGGARIIVLCDDQNVIPLFLYLKSDRDTVPTKAIREALADLELEGNSESSDNGGGDGPSD